MPDQHQDPLSTLLRAASDVYHDHEPGADGACSHSDCGSRSDTAEPEPCLAYQAANAVLDLWAHEGYTVVTSPSGTGEGENSMSASTRTSPAGAEKSANLRANGSFTCPDQQLPGGGITGHPPWCAGPPYCTADRGLSHASLPEYVDDVMLMLMRTNEDRPMISITDDDTTVVLYADSADEVGQAIHGLGQRAVA